MKNFFLRQKNMWEHRHQWKTEKALLNTGLMMSELWQMFSKKAKSYLVLKTKQTMNSKNKQILIFENLFGKKMVLVLVIGKTARVHTNGSNTRKWSNKQNWLGLVCWKKVSNRRIQQTSESIRKTDPNGPLPNMLAMHTGCVLSRCMTHTARIQSNIYLIKVRFYQFYKLVFGKILKKKIIR